MATDRPRVVLFARHRRRRRHHRRHRRAAEETVGGALMLVAAVVALLWANLGPASYQAVLHLPFGPLDLEHWAADGLLAIFFFVAGLELKRELTVGALSKPAEALVPIVAALCGMVVPALIYIGDQPRAARRSAAGLGHPDGHRHRLRAGHPGTGRARSCPTALRAFLLTLAIVDDLGSITVIAIFFSHGFSMLWFLGAARLRGAVGAAAVAADLRLVPLSAAGRALLVVHVQQRHPRHRRRRAARPADLLVDDQGAVASWTAGSTAGGRSRPASPFRSSPSSPPGCRSRWRSSAPCSPSPWGSGWSSGWSWARCSASSAAPGSPRG